MKTILLFIAILTFNLPFQDEDPEQSSDEKDLWIAINQYRKTQGLPAIPWSTQLGKVARLHAEDLKNNPPQAPCNMHSWSDKGNWTPCCYTPDHKQANCMWGKPKELSSYPGMGYEISALNSAETVNWLEQWKKSTPHHQVILNQGVFKRKTWNAVGISIRKPYAVVWFGMEKDEN